MGYIQLSSVISNALRELSSRNSVLVEVANFFKLLHRCNKVLVLVYQSPQDFVCAVHLGNSVQILFHLTTILGKKYFHHFYR